MSEFNITVEGGSSVRLPTAGKYVDRDIIVTATGSGGATKPDNTSEYQRVEYITSDAKSYFLTDFIADNTCGVELVASFPTLLDRVPMGSRLDSGTTRFYCVYPLSANSIYYGFNGGYTISCPLSINTKYRLQTNFLNSRLVNVFDENGIRKGGGNISATLTQQVSPVAIFGYFATYTNSISSMRQYTFFGARCSQGNEVVREYIPCYRKSDGVIGLYEKYTGEFLTNQGTGAFTKGADIEWGYIGSDTTPDEYNGEYEITPTVEAQTLLTANKLMTKNLLIKEIPYAEVTNSTNGTTVTIG
ncbi:MAG: hypothetical protein IKB02_05980 [Clostridia bacterium]|nr:hypothetical protein [Clostridia bacterium]MBR2388301.1 hypothetical protein [Clostridia bacterium]